MKIGITGATGGLGQRLAEILCSRGHQVRALVRKTSNTADLRAWGIALVYGDITDPSSLPDFVEGLDICYHIAAQVASASKDQLILTNVNGTRNICDSILQLNPLCRFVYCSSIVVKNVTWRNRFFMSDYTISKYKAEQVVLYAQKRGLRITIIYPGYIFGPHDRNFMDTALKLVRYSKFVVKGGEKNAPLVYVDDLCELFYLAGLKEIAIGKKYVSLKESEIGIHRFLEMLANKIDCPFPRRVYPKFPLVMAAFFLDKGFRALRLKGKPKLNMRMIGALSARAMHFHHEAVKDLGWDHTVSLPDALERAYLWYQTNRVK